MLKTLGTERILLTGAKGYIGRHIEFGLTADYGPDAVQSFDVYGDREEWEAKFRNQVSAQGFYDAIVHVGAIQAPAYTNPDIFYWNYHCTKAVAEHARKFKATKLIFFSTCMAIDPISHYGWTKRCAEDLVGEVLENCCVVRPFVVFGDEAGRTSQYSPVAKLIRNELQYTFNPWIRDYIHVQDIVRAINYIIVNDVRGKYDLGTGKGTSTVELVELWDGIRPPIVGPGEKGWPQNAPEALVARKSEMLPDFKPIYNVTDWLCAQKDEKTDSISQ